jgi:hypothetical protein
MLVNSYDLFMFCVLDKDIYVVIYFGFDHVLKRKCFSIHILSKQLVSSKYKPRKNYYV